MGKVPYAEERKSRDLNGVVRERQRKLLHTISETCFKKKCYAFLLRFSESLTVHLQKHS